MLRKIRSGLGKYIEVCYKLKLTIIVQLKKVIVEHVLLNTLSCPFCVLYGIYVTTFSTVYNSEPVVSWYLNTNLPEHLTLTLLILKFRSLRFFFSFFFN